MVVHHVAIGTVEALAGIVALTTVGFVVPGHWGLLDIQPHPLWIVVIAIAVRYGAVSGYIAGAVSAAAYGSGRSYAGRYSEIPGQESRSTP